MIILQILYVFTVIGIMSFGGGYGMISFIQNLVVVKYGWLSMSEFTDMIAISQTTPGPIAVNTATYTGYKLGGVLGAAVANLGLLLPALVIVIAVSKILAKNSDNIYVKSTLSGLKPMAVALIVASAITIGMENIVSLYNAVIMCVALFLISYLKINPIWVLLAFGILGILIL
ncbi:MAG: chromate transporter [Bacillota bacterium]|jgi:chromate transporter